MGKIDWGDLDQQGEVIERLFVNAGFVRYSRSFCFSPPPLNIISDYLWLSTIVMDLGLILEAKNLFFFFLEKYLPVQKEEPLYQKMQSKRGRCLIGYMDLERL